jgi:hypothetical protein
MKFCVAYRTLKEGNNFKVFGIDEKEIILKN